MHTRRMVLSSLLTVAIAATVLPARAAEALEPLVRDVLYVYFRVDRGEGTLREDYENIATFVAENWDEDLYQQRQRDAKSAGKRFAALSDHDLRASLIPLFSRSAAGNATYVSAAYVLASRGVDVDANVDRMASTLRRDAIGHSSLDRQVMRLIWPSAAQWLPERMADVYVAQKAPRAVRALLPENCKTDDRPRFRAALLDLMARDPDGVLRSAHARAGGIGRLAGFTRTPGDTPRAWSAARAALMKARTPQIRKDAMHILGEMRDLEYIRQCMLVTGNRDDSGFRKDAFESIKQSPNSRLTQEGWRLYTDAAAARKALGAMSQEQLKGNLTPLFTRLSRSSIPYVSVAWVLAMRGVDLNANVERATSVVSWLGNQPYPKLSEWERDSWPYWGQSDAVSPEDWPTKLAELYRKTHDPRLLDTLLTAHVVMDGAMAEGWPWAVYLLTRDYPEAVVRTASRGRGTRRLVSTLTYRESGKAQRNSVRPALKRIAAGKDKAMARVARLCLEAMNETGRRQAQRAHQ